MSDTISYKPEVQVDGKWVANSLVFATAEEAKRYASDLFQRWTLTQDHRAVESTDPVNSAIVDDRLVMLDKPQTA